MYIHELQEWPRFYCNREHIAELLASVRHQQGRLIGHMYGCLSATPYSASSFTYARTLACSSAVRCSHQFPNSSVNSTSHAIQFILCRQWHVRVKGWRDQIGRASCRERV